MAAFVPVENVCSVQLVYQQQGQTVENVYHVQFPAPPTPTTMASVAALFVTWASTVLGAVQSDQVALVKVLVSDLTSELSGGIEYATGLPYTAAVSGSQAPMNVTLAVKWLTGYRGRSYRGRTYHIGLPLAYILGSTMLATPLANILTAYRGLLAAFVSSLPTYSLVIVSRRNNRAPRIAGVATIVTAVTADSTTDSQRRRLPGRGR